ncbi:polyphosphate polymerase domain-containing protein [Rosettibacter firmus]|uniref:polyphosphate polymerase domain-containing protein n=1 Tax=Rosettibacter firmus TaxID=3111522 RepID=UPI00336BD803
MQRIELKYLVPVELKEKLKEDIIPYFDYDIHSALSTNKVYTVRSIYLDTPDLTSYHEKLSGLKIRNKFRIRGYNEFNEDVNVFLEIKRKNENYISKNRFPIRFSDVKEFLISQDLSKIVNHSIEYEDRIKAAKNFIFYYIGNNLQPVVNVIYEREAFECKFGSGLRVTFDMNLRCFLTNDIENLFSNQKTELIFNNYFILEIKLYKALPSWLRVVINKYNLKKEAISKYTLSVDKVL